MQLSLIIIFVLTYMAIAFEHTLKVNKSAFALIGAVVLWTIFGLGSTAVTTQLNQTIADVAQIVFFLMGAMAIVEVMDAHAAFDVITQRIRTKKMPHLVWIIGFLSFFMSAVLDNLASTIVMLSLIRKIMPQRDDRLIFASIVVIAANAGGAWSPIGDVTTTMLWVGEKVTALQVMKGVFIPSLVNMMVPLIFMTYFFRNKTLSPIEGHPTHPEKIHATNYEQSLVFFSGIVLLCGVPIFKVVTNLPPFMGMLLALGILWLLCEFLHRHKNDKSKQHLSLVTALQRIDISVLLFFIGILLAVSVLEHSHLLTDLASVIDKTLGNQALVIFLFGIASAVIDNVPLVAASMGMFPMDQYPTDAFIWEFLAYAAGTGGSILIIGSAAGVIAMGMEKIEFFWYVRKISLLAFVAYLSGALTYIYLN
ncbi:MAG: sodium:proton antiporter NhaD [Sulfuritalea sp.]|nr:sodium:proton antiporter NhaD [Sulfuritalea sp.]